MKWSLQSLIAIFFVISTITTSLHELSPQHNSSDCQVCTLVQNDHGLAPESGSSITNVFTPFEEATYLTQTYVYTHTTRHHSRAPPLFS